MTRLITSYFNRLAPHYDAATGLQGAWIAPAECARLLRGRLKARTRILDLGIGTGADLMAITSVRKDVVGIDISKRMLNHARLKLPRARLILADIEKPLPMPRDANFDLVLAVGVLEFVENLTEVFRHIIPHLHERGLVCFTFEEQIVQHPLQGRRRSARGTGIYRHVPRTLSFPVYRRKWLEIRKLLRAQGLVTLEHHRFRAYTLRNQNTGAKHAVIYRVVLAQKEG